MGKSYPSFQSSYSHEDLVEHFLLTPIELDLVLKCRGDGNHCGMVLLLKTLPHLGYVPGRLDEIPPEVRECREQQEVVTLSLQLLQNCLMLVNTILIERTLAQEGLWDRMNAAHRRGLTPLFHGHIPVRAICLGSVPPIFLGGGVSGQSSTPKRMAWKLVRLLRPQRPDYPYLKKVFQHTRALLGVKPSKTNKRLPELLTDSELVAFYEAVWHARNSVHMVMIKLLIFTELRNAELSQIRLKHVDLDQCHIESSKERGRRTVACSSRQVFEENWRST